MNLQLNNSNLKGLQLLSAIWLAEGNMKMDLYLIVKLATPMNRSPGTIFFVAVCSISYFTHIFDVIYDLVGITCNRPYLCGFYRWVNADESLTNLTLVMLNPDIPAFANSVDPDQLASEEANWSGSALFSIKYVNLYQQSWSSNLIGWKIEMGVAS